MFMEFKRVKGCDRIMCEDLKTCGAFWVNEVQMVPSGRKVGAALKFEVNVKGGSAT